MDRLLVSLHPFHRNKQFANNGTIVGTIDGRPDRLDDGYATTPVPPERLLSHIQHGGAWVGCTLGSHPQGKDGWRHSDVAGNANLLVLDFDGDYSLDDFWAKPFNQRHCLFTYTTCSHQKIDEKHPEAQDRFRALYLCEEHESELHPYLYNELLLQLDYKLKDNSGEKPERLWYGNDKAVIQHGAGERLGYELTENARDAMANRPAPERVAAEHDDEFAIDCKRVAFVLREILAVSKDEEYLSYWQYVYNSAASANDDEVWEAFLDWHARGHHSKKNRPQRLERDRHKAGRRSNIGKILKYAKEQKGSEWWKLLPRELQYGRSSSNQPQILYKADSARGDLPLGTTRTTVPDTVPAPAVLASYKFSASQRDAAQPQSSRVPESIVEIHDLTKLLEYLYLVVVHKQRLNNNGETEDIPSDLDAIHLEADIRTKIYEHSIMYAREPQRIEAYLFQRFLIENGFPMFSAKNRRLRTLAEPPSAPTEYVIPNLIAFRRTYLLYGKQGTGKTTLALALARAALGFPGHDSFLDFPAPVDRWQNMRVLYIATDGLDDAYNDLWNYAQQQGMSRQSWAHEYFHVLAMDSSDLASPWKMNLSDMRYLIDVLQEASDSGKPYGLVIFDSLKAICPPRVSVSDPIVLDYVTALHSICSRHNAASILIHHQSKESDTAQGVAGLPEQVAGVFRLKKDPEKGHIFVVEKTRAGHLDRYEIPYSLSGSTLYSIDDDDHDDNDTSLTAVERRHNVILGILQAHYNNWKIQNSHIPSENYSAEYRGMGRTDLLAALDQADTSCSISTLERDLIALDAQQKLQRLGATRNRTIRLYLGPDHATPSLGLPGDVPGF